MDLASISTAWQGIKSAKEIFGLVVDAKVDAAVKEKVYEAQAKLGSVQDLLFSMREEMFQLQEKNRALQDQLRDADSWKETADRYELVRTSGSAVVYRFMGDPEHYACPSCFGSKKLHILQDTRTISGKYRCTGCGSDFPVEPAKPIY